MRLPSGGWRFLWVALLALAAMLALAACEDEEEGGAPGGGERIQGGTLTVATLEGDALDPHFSSFASDISLERMLWRGLYTLDKENVPQPVLAAGPPEISEDGKTYTVKLREGLKWSDGDDLLAEDFVMGILRTCNPVNAGEYEYVVVNVVGCHAHYSNEAGYDATLEQAIGVKALDDTTVEIKLDNPQPTFTIILSMWMTFPAPVHLFPNSSDPWPEPSPDAPGKLAYNGPYTLTEFESGDHATLAPNPNWAGDVKPTLDTLTLRFIDDFAVANNAYRVGEVDFAKVNLVELKAIKAEFEPTGEYLRVIKPTTIGMTFQIAKPPLDNLDVRLALVRADDHDAENESCQQGGYVPSTSWIPEVTGGHPPDAFQEQIGFNVEKAKEHLATAGYPKGERFPVLNMLIRDDATSRCAAVLHQEEYRTNLGIETKIEVVDSPTRSARYTAQDFELFPGGGWVQDYPDPENWVVAQFNTGGSLNNYNCSDPDIDALFAKAQYNTNEEERLAQYKQINELIVTRVCGYGPFLHVADHYLIKPYAVGLGDNSTGQDGVIAGDWAAEYWGRSE